MEICSQASAVTVQVLKVHPAYEHVMEDRWNCDPCNTATMKALKSKTNLLHYHSPLTFRRWICHKESPPEGENTGRPQVKAWKAQCTERRRARWNPDVAEKVEQYSKEP